MLDGQCDEAHVQQVFGEQLVRIRFALRDIARDPRFREALTWQNRRALSHGVDWLLRRSEKRAVNSAEREKQRLIASYLQRYCVKNDSIGFFGPFAWGELATDDDAITARPGPKLVARRGVYFEHWAIATLAKALASDDELWPELAPRLLPVVAIEGTTLRYAADKVVEVPALIARLLEACDGETSARNIARTLLADPSLDLATEEDVYDLLAQLAEQRLIVWTLQVPAGLNRPERVLARSLERIQAPHVRQRAQASLARLEAARAHVESVSGDAHAVGEALDQLNTTFSDLTAVAPTRREGETYAGRTVVYEDCRRDLLFTLGDQFSSRMGPVLSPVVQSARWYTFEIAKGYRRALGRAYDQLCDRGSSPIGFARFWSEAGPLFARTPHAPPALVAEVAGALSERWRSLLEIDPASRRVTMTAASLREKVARAFSAPGPGWPSARHCSPDVLIAGRDPEAVSRGECTFVLGELHMGNTLHGFAALQQHPQPDILVKAQDHDLCEPIVSPVDAGEMVSRADHTSWSARDFHVELGPSPSWRPRAQVMRVADLVVERQGDDLAVVDRASGRSFDIIAFVDAYLTFASSGDFRLLPRGRHTPRVTVDGVVLCREQWNLSPSESPLVRAKGRYAQFLTARRWARELGLPRWIFVKVPEEPKPIYIDLDSPIYVEMLAKLLRHSSRIAITEMLPSVDEVWLPDADGHAYTFEIRMVAVDPVRWRPPKAAGAHGG